MVVLRAVFVPRLFGGDRGESRLSRARPLGRCNRTDGSDGTDGRNGTRGRHGTDRAGYIREIQNSYSVKGKAAA